MKRRIEKEIQELRIIYNNIDIKEINNNKEIIINNKKIILSKYYPFEMPIFHINNIDYNEYLYINNHKINEILKKYFNITCLCCSSLLCKNNWHPRNTIQDLFKELDNTNYIKTNVKNMIFLEILSKKYNIINIVFNDIKNYLF